MRDHLLGCTQFIPDVENERVMPPAKAKPFALGIPTRAYPRFEEKHFELLAVDDSETTDHTPAGMMADFPREYDLKTMLNEAACRRDFLIGDWGKSLYDLMQEFDEQVQRQRSINDLVLNANKLTMRVGVDLGRPGGDRSAVAVRKGPEMSYPTAWDSLFPRK